MKKHVTNEVLMIRPAGFMFNEQTAVNNIYQNKDDKSPEDVQKRALREFDNMVEEMRNVGIKVHVLQDTVDPSTPDSIFPNNWFSTHDEKRFVLYPMFAENRRLEVDKHRASVEKIVKDIHGEFKTFNYLDYADKNKFLEGTGSMVIDRKNDVAYAVISPRTDKDLFVKYCEDLGFKPVFFESFQDGGPVYHTNVIMGLGEKVTIICLESIKDEEERKMVRKSLEDGGNIVLDITLAQVKQFLGNTLEVKGNKDKNILIMSDVAYRSLTKEQLDLLNEHVHIIHPDITTIEFYGGGSARCMVAEIF